MVVVHVSFDLRANAVGLSHFNLDVPNPVAKAKCSIRDNSFMDLGVELPICESYVV